MAEHKKNILITGGSGLVGGSLIRFYLKKNIFNIFSPNRKELDLTKQDEVFHYLKKNNIHEIFVSAGKVGGINANNSYPADFIYENLQIVSNLIFQAYQNNIKKLLYFGSSCIYPKYSTQPMPESALLTGVLEPTNESYALAKIAGLKLCESFNRQYGTDYRSVMPTNLYGPGDNYSILDSHVVPALLRRFHEAKLNDDKQIKVWGSGDVYREFLYVDDLIDACDMLYHLPFKDFQNLISERIQFVNIGFGKDILIKDLAHLISNIVGYKGKIVFDSMMPSGTPRKLIDSSKIFSIGWKPKFTLEEGLMLTYEDFKNNKKLRK